MSEPSPIPEGFSPHDRKSPVTDPWEPLFSRRRDGVVEIGVALRAAHANSRGFAHGGVIAALADNAMGLSYGATLLAANPDAAQGGGAVTVSLTLDYLATARVGQWLQITPRVLRAGGSMGFVDALVTADGAPVARASATFRRV
ncbi:MAG: PaaI family thioesterase [Alphaproteobacteria bacterium]|nr:PaaI family thioesterase [Alphaproteobacteria bacterium]